MDRIKSEIDKARLSLNEFMRHARLFDEEYYDIAKKRPSSYFEAQIIVREHSSAAKRYEALMNKLTDIEREMLDKLGKPESSIQDVQEDPAMGSIASEQIDVALNELIDVTATQPESEPLVTEVPLQPTIETQIM